MNTYQQIITAELKRWQQKMLRHPSTINKLTKKLQDKINGYIPGKIHQVSTRATTSLGIFGVTSIYSYLCPLNFLNPPH